MWNPYHGRVLREWHSTIQWTIKRSACHSRASVPVRDRVWLWCVKQCVKEEEEMMTSELTHRCDDARRGITPLGRADVLHACDGFTWNASSLAVIYTAASSQIICLSRLLYHLLRVIWPILHSQPLHCLSSWLGLWWQCSWQSKTTGKAKRM